MPLSRTPSSSTLPSLPMPSSERLPTPAASTDDYVMLVSHHVSQQFLNEGRFVGDATGALRLCLAWHKPAAATAAIANRTRSATASGSDSAAAVCYIVSEINMNPVDCVEGAHDLSSRPPSAVPKHAHHKLRSKSVNAAASTETQRAMASANDVLFTNPLLIQTVDEQILYDKVVFLTHIAVFARLPLSTLIYISGALDLLMFDSQEALTFQDDDDVTVFMLISGTVVAKVNHDSQTDRRRSKDGQRRTVHEGKRRYLATRRHHYIDVVTFGPYGICGDEAIIGHNSRLYSLIATSAVSAYAINFTQIWPLLDANTQSLLYDMAQYNHAVRQRTILLASKRSAAFKDSPIAFQHFLDQNIHRKLQHRNAETPQPPPAMLISRPGSRRYRPEYSENGAVDYFVQPAVDLQLTKNPTDNDATPARLRHKLQVAHDDSVQRTKLKPIIPDTNAQTAAQVAPSYVQSPPQQDSDDKTAALPLIASPPPLPRSRTPPVPMILPPSLPSSKSSSLRRSLPDESMIPAATTATSNKLHIVDDELSHNRFITPKLFIPSTNAEAPFSLQSRSESAAPPLILTIFDDGELSRVTTSKSHQSVSATRHSTQPHSIFSSRQSLISALNRPFASSTISFASKVRRKASVIACEYEEEKKELLLPRVSLTSVVAVSRALLEAGDINNPLVDPRVRAVYFFGDKRKQRPRR